ncbi:hypothetical protein MsAg5_06920 [Methanosarcinaceae archaeon Ag5]|uniref:Uncharacterized protein n=1 Tax=Methanolapillus africanus TaxID=3028297 RepID=A0AAE4MIJ9_9EURY|nr:hypothetical protein [Methanosarcinaceae archaeon Ag5]
MQSMQNVDLKTKGNKNTNTEFSTVSKTTVTFGKLFLLLSIFGLAWLLTMM